MEETATFIKMRKMVMFVNGFSIVNYFIAQLSWAPLLAEIAKDVQVDMGSATQLMAIFAFTAAIGLLVGGFLCDRIGVMKVLAIGLSFAVIPAFVMPWLGESYSMVFGLRLLQGFSGGVICTASPILATWYPPQQRGVAGGKIGLSISLGSALGALISPALYMATGGNWQHTVAWLSVPGWLNIALIFAAIRKLNDSGVQHQAQSEAGGMALKNALRMPVTWLGVVVAFLIAWSMQGTYALAPAYLAAAKPVGLGFGPMLAGQLMLAIMLAGMVGPIIGGILLDKTFAGNPRPVMLLGFALSAIFLYGLVVPRITSSVALLVIVMALFGTVIQFLYPAMQVLIAQIYSREIVGSLLGIWMGIGSFGGAAAMLASGILVTATGNYDSTFIMLAGAALLGLIIMPFLKTAKPEVKLSSNNHL